MKRYLFFLPVFLLMLFFFSCANKKETQESLNVFRYNESNGISGLDPAFARSQSLIWPVNQIFNGLVQMDDQMQVIPSVASSWKISDDGKTYSFRIRQDVVFHDHPGFPNGKGRFVKASDFLYSFERILDPSLRSPGRWVFSVVDENGFSAPDDSTFIIRLKRPFSPFLGILCMPYCFVVPHEIAGSESQDFDRQPCGTGPFQFKLWRQEEKLVLVKNQKYFEKDSSGIVLPYLDGISIRFIKDKQSEFMEFLLGNIDFLSGVHPSYKDELITRSGKLNPAYSDRIKIISQDYLNTEYLAFLVDTSLDIVKNNPLMNTDVRKAINYGFDRVKMMKYLRNNIGSPALGGFVPYGMKGYDPMKTEGYYYHPDTVAWFLNRAGYPGGEGLEPITLTTTSDYLDLCEFIQFELQKSGIQLNIEISTGLSFRNMVQNSNLAFFRASWIADYPDPESYLSLFYSGNFSPAGPNYTHFSNPAYDSLYVLSNQINEEAERLMLLQQMDQIIMEESVIVPLYYDQVLRFVHKNIDGFSSNPMNLLKLKFVRKQF